MKKLSSFPYNEFIIFEYEGSIYNSITNKAKVLEKLNSGEYDVKNVILHSRIKVKPKNIVIKDYSLTNFISNQFGHLFGNDLFIFIEKIKNDERYNEFKKLLYDVSLDYPEYEQGELIEIDTD